ncbi:MAG: hypothetical protein ABIJ00_01955 [Candidatus Eisenbacteria bacterium]
MRTLLVAAAVLIALGLPAAGATQTGYIQVKAPEGVQILLDDTLKGVTSEDLGGLILQEVSIGRHEIKALRDGFCPKSFQINVQPGKVSVCEISTLAPQIQIAQTGASSEIDIQQHVGSLKIQSLPIDCAIRIPALDIAWRKTKDEWVASGIPVGEYRTIFSALGRELNHAVVIEDGVRRHLMVNFIHSTVTDITLPPEPEPSTETLSSPSAKRSEPPLAVSQNWRYFLTVETYRGLDDYKAQINARYGPSAEVADWTEIKRHFGDNISRFLDDVGLEVSRDGGALITRDGDPKYSSSRAYFLTRHGGNKPGYYLAHDQIGGHEASLGSWDTSQRVLVRTPERE